MRGSTWLSASPCDAKPRTPAVRQRKRKTHAARGPRIRPRQRLGPQRHLLGNNLREVRLLEAVDLLIKFVDLAGPVHRAELWSAHRTERRLFVVVVRQRLVVHAARGLRVERERELFVPIEGVARMRNRVVAVPRSRAMTRDVRRVRRDLVGDDAVLYILLVRQA